MDKDPDILTNPYARLTTAAYNSRLDIYDPGSNANAAFRNQAPSNSWTNEQKAYNLTLPTIGTILNVQWGAIINFQLIHRDWSMGIHNPAYTQAILNNTLDALTQAGY
jgi:hypothetical protein